MPPRAWRPFRLAACRGGAWWALESRCYWRSHCLLWLWPWYSREGDDEPPRPPPLLTPSTSARNSNNPCPCLWPCPCPGVVGVALLRYKRRRSWRSNRDAIDRQGRSSRWRNTKTMNRMRYTNRLLLLLRWRVGTRASGMWSRRRTRRMGLQCRHRRHRRKGTEDNNNNSGVEGRGNSSGGGRQTRPRPAPHETETKGNPAKIEIKGSDRLPTFHLLPLPRMLTIPHPLPLPLPNGDKDRLLMTMTPM
mmetsp:Transcript_30055/g.48571  ORF Transcript_30055/g.48571 Transcript_30055/m.48571 type:complete len:248 (+) Transcript_30055:203-946(+)